MQMISRSSLVKLRVVVVTKGFRRTRSEFATSEFATSGARDRTSLKIRLYSDMRRLRSFLSGMVRAIFEMSAR